MANPLEDHRGARATILVVDDNEQNRHLAEACLVSFGYDVVLASDGLQALQRFAATPIDLVLLDVQMPHMDGFETCRRLRALPRGERAPIIFLTAFGETEAYARAVDARADDFLMKPIQRTELQIRVRSLLRLKALEHELLESNALIREQRDALFQAQESRRELSAMIVHDLKNPLSAAAMNGQWLLDVAPLQGEHREAMFDLLQACGSMHRLVMDLLDVERSDSGKLVPNLSEVAPTELFERCIRELRARAREANHPITASVADDVPTIHADLELLVRTLGNLMENAMKYAPGGSDVRLESRRHGDSHVRFLVRDRGPGIPPEKRSRIFEPYARLDRDSELHARESRGLGLAFCRRAIEAHGGRLWIEDDEPVGTAFCIELPIAAPLSA